MGRVLEEHALLSNEAAGHAHTTNLITQRMERDESHSLRQVLKNGREIEAVVDQVVDMDIHLQRALGGACADMYQISQSSLDVNVHSRDNVPSVAGNIQDISHGEKGQSLPGRPKSRQAPVVEHPVEKHTEISPMTLMDVLKPPDGSGNVRFPLEQRKPTGNVLCGNVNFSRLRGNTNRVQSGQDGDRSSEILLTEVMGQWHKSLQDLQAGLNSLGKNRNVHRLVSDVIDLGSEGTQDSACRVLEENLQSLENLKDRLLKENAGLDEEIANVTKLLRPLGDKINAEGPSEADFAVEEEI